MTKVISFKTTDEVYNALKSLDLTFKQIIEPLVEQYLNSLNSDEYTNSIPYDKAISQCLGCRYYQIVNKSIDDHLKHESSVFNPVFKKIGEK